MNKVLKMECYLSMSTSIATIKQKWNSYAHKLITNTAHGHLQKLTELVSIKN